MNNTIRGYLPDEKPSFGELILFALQQIVVMFPATVLVALLTGFHVSTTIFASGFATLCFILVTKKKIPLFYGSSFSYISAITGLMSSPSLASLSLNEKIGYAQFGIMMSGLVSILAGFVVKKFGKKFIDRVLPPAVTGSIAMIIGLSLVVSAFNNSITIPTVSEDLTSRATNFAWIIALVTLFTTIFLSVYLKGKFSQYPILFGLLCGYVVALIIDYATGFNFVDFNKLATDRIVALPEFTLPVPNWYAVAAIMPIAIATIPESTAHIFQLDIYVKDLAKKKGSKKIYDIDQRLGDNLIGDGIGDIVSSVIGGPAGTNYGENISAMALTKNFSVAVLVAAAVITMIISMFTPLINIVYSIPNSVIGGLSIYMFGVIAAQGVAIMLEKQVDMFSAKNLAVIAVILVVGLGGTFKYSQGAIEIFGGKIPAIAAAAILGILLNFLLSFGEKNQPKIEHE